jgi:dTDP-glucose 4,6-dehydratase
LGFSAATTFADGLAKTVQWNLDNRSWLFEKMQYLKDLWQNVYIKK